MMTVIVLYHLKMGSELIVPDSEYVISNTSAAHLAKLVKEAIEKSIVGAFNAISYPRVSIKSIIEFASYHLSVSPQLEQVNRSQFDRAKVNQWSDLPLWIDGNHFTYSNQKLESEFGSRPSSFEDALVATIKHFENLNWPEPQYGLSPAQIKQRLSKAEFHD
jgi:hypothetical protein